VFFLDNRYFTAYVEKVDDIDAYDFFSGILGKVNPMKSPKGRFHLALRYSLSGCFLLQYPADDKILFDTHTLHFSDGSSFEFKMGFINRLVSTRDETEPEDLLSNVVSFEKEIESIKRIHNRGNVLKESNRVSPRDDLPISCSVKDDINVLTVSSFNPKTE